MFPDARHRLPRTLGERGSNRMSQLDSVEVSASQRETLPATADRYLEEAAGGAHPQADLKGGTVRKPLRCRVPNMAPFQDDGPRAS